MLKNYIKIAWRNIFRQKLFSVINILGLAVSLSAFFTIIQYVGFEKSYDRFHEKADEIYRVNTTRSENGKINYHTALSVANAGPFLKEQFEEVEAFTRMLSMQSNFVCAVSYTEGGHTVTFNERNVYYGDPDFFTVFSFPLLSGDKSTALTAPFTAVISHDAARKYFGDKDPVGQIIRFVNSSEEHDYRITGVLGNLNNPSHLAIDFLFSYPSLMSSAFRENAYDNWNSESIYTYVIASRQIDPSILNERLHAYFRNISENQPDITMHMRPLTDIHLTGGLQDEPTLIASETVVDFLLIVACFIVALAWINYSNLAIADTLRRAREVGLRRIIGADRWHIIAQFAVQFMLINFLALMLACVLVPLASPVLQQIAGMPVEFRLSGLPLLPLVAFFAAGMLVSGGYPAYALSRLSPGNSIRGTYFRGPRNTFTRQLLVGLQFCVSIALVTGTLVIHRQMNFMQHAELGMSIDNTVVVKAPIFTDSTSDFRHQTFREALLARPTIHDVVLSSTLPAGQENGWIANIRRHENDKTGYPAEVNVIDRNFIGIFDIALSAGRDFLPSDYRSWERFGDQIESVLINESLAVMLGFDSAEAALYKEFFWGNNRCKVVGVLSDFHQRSLRYEMKPAVFVLDKNGTNFSIKISGVGSSEERRTILAQIENSYRKFFPDDPFEYFFLEDRFNEQYQDDRRFSTLFSVFSVLALFIAWLGLAGLIAFFLLYRQKEIGIRKVLGATVASILEMVTKSYVKLGLICLVIVIPITHYFITQWLERYAYHITPDWWMFGIPGVVVLLATIVVIVGQAMKSALTNPAESLRNE